MTAADQVPRLIPVRMLNEHVYCPRLAYLEWADQGFRDSDDTVEGRFVHRRVEQERGKVASPEEPDGIEEGGSPPPSATSVTLSSDSLGLVAKIDVLETEVGRATPVEYKKGRPRSADQPLWDPELVQLCAQVLLLRDAGYEVDHAEVYFAETRSRHRIAIGDELIAATMAAITALRETVSHDSAPPPLVDSPKCPRCSLVGICLPDEVNYLRGSTPKPLRRLVVSDPPSTPLYVTTQGSHLSKRGGRAVLSRDGTEQDSRRIIDISHLALYGNVTASSALLRELFDRGAPVIWLTFGGWLSGIATGMPPGNVAVRMRQHRAAAIGAPRLASAFVAGKVRNCRTLLRRHAKERAAKPIAQLTALARQAQQADSIEALLGLEGTAARIYFPQFGHLLAKRSQLGEFAFKDRTRRPPRDRTNALLSFLYSLLTKDAVTATFASGLDPYVGVLHRPRFGRPALALDLAEEFRPLVCDSTALMAINNQEVRAGDFIERAGSVALTPAGRRKVIAAYERRMSSELRHPVFGYRASYRRTLELQARLLAGVLVGDCPEYRPLTTR